MITHIFFSQPYEPTPGEYNRYIGFGFVCVMAAVLASGITLSMHTSGVIDASVLPVWAAAASSSLAAACGLGLAGSWFGGKGLLGRARALVGGFIVTITTMGLLMFAAILFLSDHWGDLVLHILTHKMSPLPGFWCATLAVAHHYCKLLCEEYESIFRVRRAPNAELSELSAMSGLASPESIALQQLKWGKS